jgi:hypothetical protein
MHTATEETPTVEPAAGMHERCNNPFCRARFPFTDGKFTRMKALDGSSTATRSAQADCISPDAATAGADMKKKRCAICGLKLGLGVRFRNRWTTAGWKHLRFCGKRCAEREKHDRNKQTLWYSFLAHLTHADA